MNPFMALVDLIIPRVCHICEDKLLANEEFVCATCMERLPVTGYEKYWADRTGCNSDLNPMEQRFAGQLPMVHACAPFFYTRGSALASLIHDFKYRGFSRLGVTLGRKGALAILHSGLFDGVDILLPVPIHWTKRMKRGYNQTEMLAKGVSQATGIPIGSQLQARRRHRTQTSLNSGQRYANTKGVFKIDDPGSLRGRHIMIVDDICTTGATLLAAGEALGLALENDFRLSFFTLGVV